jgi:hypothetical protein
MDIPYVNPGSAPRSTTAPVISLRDAEAARLRSLLTKVANAHLAGHHAECERLLRAFQETS